MKKLCSSTAHQKARLLAHLQKNGRITTLQARSKLDVLHPAARISDLKRDGHVIITYRRHADTGLGRHKHIAEYVLFPGEPA